MARKKKAPKPVKLNSTNAISVANRGMNPAYTQTQTIKKGNEDTGRMMTRTKIGRMSEDGKRAGGKTWTMTPKNDDGSPVLGKNGKPRQSGRSSISSRRQRDYDIRVGLQKAWQDENGLWHGGTPPAGASARQAARITTG